MRIEIPLRRAYRLINHGPTVLLSAAHGGRANVMAAAWVMALDFDPPKVAAVIAADTYTRELVEASGEFVVNLPTAQNAWVTYRLGTVSGREEDKLERYGLATSPASKVSAPLLDGCIGWLECKVLREPAIAERYDLFLAEVVAAWADDQLFVQGEWRFAADARRTIHHHVRGIFFATGERIEAGEDV